MKRRKDSPAKRAFRKVKPKTVNWWKKKAWSVFSKWIRTRDNWTCYTCGKHYPDSDLHRNSIHAGHFITRARNNTMFCEVNVHAQCYNCNVQRRGNIGEYAYRLKKELGEAGFNDLLERGRKDKQFTIPELEAIIERYKLEDK